MLWCCRTSTPRGWRPPRPRSPNRRACWRWAAFRSRPTWLCGYEALHTNVQALAADYGFEAAVGLPTPQREQGA